MGPGVGLANCWAIAKLITISGAGLDIKFWPTRWPQGGSVLREIAPSEDAMVRTWFVGLMKQQGSAERLQRPTIEGVCEVRKKSGKPVAHVGRQKGLENPIFSDFASLIPPISVDKSLDPLYFHVEDIEGFAWAQESLKSDEK
ncbi:hypothetical protein E3N88_16292 [Mikania micrantha]|uniref:Uncharacterized protein n=1 Tax=Mikania micrantha TaxID=192012 RepID=A0A5N6NYE5_9ASTR|nr:hypothetical protein E3N88_16292 [Mikania micrantha]